MIVIIDNQMGNIKSVSRALDFLGVKNTISSDPEVIKTADKLILPGVGNFSEASKRLKQSGLMEIIREYCQEKPMLGICLGMQLLFETGYEDGKNEGLGLIPGHVSHLSERIGDLPIPHIGWNDIAVKDSKVFQGIDSGSCVYFVHSFEAITDEKYISAKTNYGNDVVAAVENGNVYGAQFHPEKSQTVGIKILKNFIELC